MSEKTADEIVAAAARRIAMAALALFVADQHRWSPRVCSTCRAITGILGTPFGCDAHRESGCTVHQCTLIHERPR